MECPKCKGLMMLERFSDFFLIFYAWKCINCGAIIDRTISSNRRKSLAARDAQPASVADDAASQRSKNTQKGPSAATLAAPLPPSYIVIETVNELKRVLDSVKVQQNQSDYAVAKVAEISTGLRPWPSGITLHSDASASDMWKVTTLPCPRNL